MVYGRAAEEPALVNVGPGLEGIMTCCMKFLHVIVPILFFFGRPAALCSLMCPQGEDGHKCISFICLAIKSGINQLCDPFGQGTG